jgi:poly-D-alanine transfer protein DltD
MAKQQPKSSFFLTPRLNILGKGEDQKDKVLLPNPDPTERDVETSRKLVASLPLDIRTRRDLAIDYMNPQETLPKYIKSEDENPAFDFSTLTMIYGDDGLAKQTVNLIQQGRAAYIKEENKYNSVYPENASAIVDGAPTYSDLQTLIDKNLEMRRVTALDATSSL